MDVVKLKALPFLVWAAWSGTTLAAEEAGDTSAPPATAAPGEPADEIVRPEGSGLFPGAAPDGVPSMQMSTEYGSPITALGGYRPVGQVDSGGVRIEPATVRASVHGGVGYNDNVALSTTNKVSSLFLTLSPSLSVGLDGSSQRYYLVYRGNYGYYTAANVDNFEEHNVGLTAAKEWTSRFRTRASYEFVRGHDPRGSTGTASAEPDVWNVHAFRALASYGVSGAPARIEGSATHVSRRYVNNRAVTALRDYDSLDFGGTFFYRLTPKTYGLLEVRRTDITHEANPGLDSSEMRYLTGATWEATAKTSGSVKFGYMSKDIESPTVPSFSRFTYDASVTWAPLTYSSLLVSGRRTFNEAIEAGSSFVVDTTISVAWMHGWSDRVRSSALYVHAEQDHQGLSRVDTYNSLGLRVNYAFDRRVRFGAEIRHDNRSSPVPGFDYSRNITLLSVETSL